MSALIVRRAADSATFVSALLPGDDGTASVAPLALGGAAAGNAAGVQLVAGGTTYEVLVLPDLGPVDAGGRAVAGGQILVTVTDAAGASHSESAPLA